jgi:hypothetical protein
MLQKHELVSYCSSYFDFARVAVAFDRGCAVFRVMAATAAFCRGLVAVFFALASGIVAVTSGSGWLAVVASGCASVAATFNSG